MSSAQYPPPEAIGAVADQIFGLLQADGPSRIPTVGDHAYQYIWVQLVTGTRKPGEHLSDVEIAASLGVSRTPVREALRRLVQEELVRADPRRGFWVREFSARDIQEFYDIRTVLETLALQQGAASIPAADLRGQLDQVASLRNRLPANPVLDFLRHDFQFHNLVISASDNGRLLRILATLRAQVSIFQIRDTGFPQRISDALDGHERILRALQAGNVDLAASLLADHIADSRDAVLDDFFAGSDNEPGHHPEHPPAMRVHAPPPHRENNARTRLPQASSMHGEAPGTW